MGVNTCCQFCSDYGCCLGFLVIISPHHMHTLDAAYWYRDVSRSMVSVCACMLDTWVSCTKVTELMEMPIGGLTDVGPRNHVLDGVKIGRNNLQ